MLAKRPGIAAANVALRQGPGAEASKVARAGRAGLTTDGRDHSFLSEACETAHRNVG